MLPRHAVIPDDVPEETRRRSRSVARATIGALDCTGDGEIKLAANCCFAATSSLLNVSACISKC